MLRFITYLFCLFGVLNLSAQIHRVEFVENKGQWQDQVQFKAKIPAGYLYVEQDELTYQFYNPTDIERLHALHHGEISDPRPEDFIMDLHAFKMKFVGGSLSQAEPSKATSDYVNFYLGNDQSKWASGVKKYQVLRFQEVYPNIGLTYYLKENHLKYDFIVAPGGDVSKIQLEYEGVDEIAIRDGKLFIKTSVNELIEQAPYAYQMRKGKQKAVKCNFKLEGNRLTFEFPRGYDKTKELIIDPTLIFASYSGATADNWGYTSTFDNAGNLYGGGVTFGAGYPTTVGAYQINFAGGNGNYAGGCDISISKFSSNGTNLIYSTYLGGLENESPHSLIVNSNDELIVLGTTASADFPVTLGAYQTVFNGGTTYTGTIPNYVSGSDIIVAKFNLAGTNLLGSTFVGGTGNDGLNIAGFLNYNYADEFRGEVIVDASDNVYVASSTFSADFPVTPGAFQGVHGGGQDGCIFKMNPNLTNMIWSSFIGGTNDDAAYSLQFSTLGEILITGGSLSPDFPTTPGTLQPAYSSGTDGWLTKIDNAASSIVASTFLGTNDYDQCYFVQLDSSNNVYVVGQTEGPYPITPATVYNNPNSGQFLHKLTSDLSTTVFSTTFGTSSGEIDIALSAFLVNECNYMFISGWGGVVNTFNGGPAFSTTTGMPITAGAVQATTDGSDYYLMMLAEDADTILYGTFFGGNNSNDHVDGGTSRFDKRGIVYQAVCSSCGAATADFPTTPGVWSQTNNSSNCNLGVFKIDLTSLTADANVYTTPYHCLGDTVFFQNLSNGGISYYWDLGDGDTSSLYEPVHVYDSIGTYNVMLVSLDSITCLKRDTDFVDIFIGGPPTVNIAPTPGVCRGDSLQLSASAAQSYTWFPNYNIIDDTTATPTVWPDTTTTYTLIAYDSCGSDTTNIVVQVFQRNISIMPDTMICLGQSAQLRASGGGSYVWTPAATLVNPNTQTPTATPNVNTVYNVQVTDPNGCVWDTSMTVLVDNNFPLAQGSVPDTICFGDSVEIYASGGNTYAWSPAATLSNPNDSNTYASPTQTTVYTVVVANGCGVDSTTVTVPVHNISATIVDDTTVCIGNHALLWADGGVSYRWYSTPGVILGYSANFYPKMFVPTTFYVDIVDHIGCEITLSVFVDTLANPTSTLPEIIKLDWGTKVQLDPHSNGLTFWWEPPSGLSCLDCPNPIVDAQESTTYNVTIQGANGCYTHDTVTIIYDGSIYVANTFTPGGDGINDMFLAFGKDIVEFKMYIFNRWGEQLFFSDDMSVGWDGTYKGKMVQTGTYVYKIEYIDIVGDEGTLYGNVNLLR